MNNFSHFPHKVCVPYRRGAWVMGFPSPVRHMEWDDGTRTIVVITDGGVYRVMPPGEVPE